MSAIQKAAEQKAVAKKPNTMMDYIKTMMPAVKAALPSVMTPERFTRIVTSAVSSNQTLAQCTPQSFLGAMMTAAQLGLECNTPMGYCYLIPYRNHGQLECQFQLGYRGLIELAYRSGNVSSISAEAVHENDEFSYTLGLNPTLEHKPAISDRGDVVAYYAVFKTKDGGFGFQVAGIDEIRNHAKKYSKSFGSSSSPWASNFDEMAKKTLIKRVLKYAPIRAEFARQIVQDETIKTSISDDMSEIPNIIEYEEVAEVDEKTGEVKEESK